MKGSAMLRRAAPDPALAPRLEAQAQQVAKGTARPGPQPMAPQAFEATPGLQHGRPLASDLRAAMEARLGRDFGMVRVHTDAAAAETAERSSARAFAHGNDLAFAPGAFAPEQPGGAALLAHELAHVAQQQDGGAAHMARDPKPAQAGIGSAPPQEDFITLGDRGAEDGHALFDLNGAQLGDGGLATLLAAIGKPEGPVTVHLHGYASSEGDAGWNMNLSAHRAAAAKQALLEKLPEGSRIVLFAHGATADFGAPSQNRRVGVSVIGPVEQTGFQLKPVLLVPPLRFGLDEPPPLQLDPTRPLTPQLFPIGPDFSQPPDLQLLGPGLPPLTTRRDLMDLAGMSAGLAARGVAPGFYGNVVDLWDAGFLKYKRLGLGDDWAARLANMEASSALSSQAEHDQPNAIDRANAEWKAANPDERATPIFQSPNLLDVPNWFSKKKKP